MPKSRSGSSAPPANGQPSIHRLISSPRDVSCSFQRTPLFLIGGSRFTRWSWYLRLPGPVVHPMSGIARCELPGKGTASDAARRADTVTVTLPRYASEPHKDARAPQNLYPIAGLEDQLRRRLGDRDLMERALRVAAQ